MNNKVKKIIVHWKDKLINLSPHLTLNNITKELKKQCTDLPMIYKFCYVDPDGKRVIILNDEGYTNIFKNVKTNVLILEVTTSLPQILYPELSSVQLTETSKEALNNASHELVNFSLRPVSEEYKEEIIQSIYCGSDSFEVKKEFEQIESYYHGDEELKEEPLRVLSPEPVVSQVVEKDSEKKNVTKIKTVPCIACEGKKVNKKNQNCKKCDGTGIMNSSLYKYFQKEIEKELHITHSKLNSNTIEPVMDLLKSSVYMGKTLVCSVCKLAIVSGEPAYICKICNNTFCDECENYIEHPHALIKVKLRGKKKKYKLQVRALEESEDIVEAHKEFYKVFTVKNIGEKKWPRNTLLVPKEGDALEAESICIGDLEPGQSLDIVVKLITPNVSGCYVQSYQFTGGKEVFGDELIVVIRVRKNSMDDRIQDVCDEMMRNNELPYDMKSNFERLLQISDKSGKDPKVLLKELKAAKNDINVVINKLFD